MKNYKEYGKDYIGTSDIAKLTIIGGSEDGEKYFPLRFGQDDSYTAYICDEDAEIGSHYHLEATFKDWIWIYDDTERTKSFDADEIRIYRACEMGCIIQLIKKENKKMKKLYVCDRETWNNIEEVSSIEEGEKIIEKFEEEDKKDGTYTPNFYEVVEKEA